jgi:succinylarginine dihydrolase
MEEKRRYKRLPIKLQLEVSEVFKQDNDIIKNLHAEIEVFDISKAGIGFVTSTDIPVGYYFNATILMENTEQKILTVVKILRKTETDAHVFRYGCEFVGLASIFDSVFDEYERSIAEQQ